VPSVREVLLRGVQRGTCVNRFGVPTSTYYVVGYCSLKGHSSFVDENELFIDDSPLAVWSHSRT